MKLPDEIGNAMAKELGHRTFSTELTRRDEAIVRHCAKVCEDRVELRHGWDKHGDAAAILAAFGLEDK